MIRGNSVVPSETLGLPLQFCGDNKMINKSDLLRWSCYMYCLRNPGMRAYLCCRTFHDLEVRHTGFIKYEVLETGHFNRKFSCIEFNNGSRLSFCYAEKEKDVYLLAGAEIHLLAFDKKEDFMDFQVRYLLTRIRYGCWEPGELDKGSMPEELDSAAL